MSESVATTGDAALKIVEAAADLTRKAQTLRSDVDRFLERDPGGLRPLDPLKRAFLRLLAPAARGSMAWW